MAFDATSGVTAAVRGRRVKIGVLIGNGGRLKAIWDGTQQLTSLAELAIVVSFKKNSPGIERAREMKIPAYTVRWPQYKAAGKTRTDFDMDVATMLKGCGVELVVIAGWGLLLTKEFLEHFQQRVINIHPALLTDTLEPKVRTITGSYVPVFRGNNALEMAFVSGVDTTGCTVHYVTEEVDTGPIILKREVVIRPGDNLEIVSERVHEAEDDILPQAIEIACEKIVHDRS